MNPSKNRRSHRIPRERAISDSFHGEGFVIEEKIERKADEGNIQVFLEGKCQGGFTSTRRTVDDNDFARGGHYGYSGVHNRCCYLSDNRDFICL